MRWLGCYGRNEVAWGGASGNETHFTAQRRLFGTPANAWVTFYQGPLTLIVTEVPAAADIRVNACNAVGCSAYSEFPYATYYPQCPNP